MAKIFRLRRGKSMQRMDCSRERRGGGTWYFGQDFNESHRESAVVRSRFYFGLPLKGFESRQDRYDEQQYLFQTWASDVLLPYLETASSESLQVLSAFL